MTLETKAYVLVISLFLASGVLAKGRVVGIEVSGVGTGEPLRITDPRVLRVARIGGYSSEIAANTRCAKYAMAEYPHDQDSFMIDWSKGIAKNRRFDLPRFEVTIYLEATRNITDKYIFTYEADFALKQGYIYLPTSGNDLVLTCAEGNWLHASDEWDEIVMPLLVKMAP